MKFLFFALLFISALSIQAQDFPREKVRYSVGMFTSSFEIGDQEVTEDQLISHFKHYDTNAYSLVNKARSQAKTANILLLTGSAGLLLGLLSKSTSAQIGGYGAAVASYSGALVFALSSGNNLDQSITTYNTIN